MKISKKKKWKAISFKFADLYVFVHTCKIVQNNMFFKTNSSTEINTQRVSRGMQGLASDGSFGLQIAGRCGVLFRFQVSNMTQGSIIPSEMSQI
jgi:hypothetical protein